MVTHQDEIVAFLSKGASYGLPGTAVERIETHCSHVFLVGDRAYKLKRPVAFSSLDYTSLERREAACHAELVLNRRTAPELYLAVHAVRRGADGSLSLDGPGAAIDWLVAMRRFDQADLFEWLADRGSLTPGLIRALAEEIAQLHETAQHMPAFGGAAGLCAAIERNRSDQHTVGAILGHDAIDALHQASLGALARAAPLLDRRREEGRVRRCHGDLRLANICLSDGRPTLFDAIDFSDQVACVDVLYDLAFLLMDLHQRGLDLLANILFNRYLDVTGDGGGLATLPLMLSLRAATRAYALAGSAQRRTCEDEVRQHVAAARSHLALASSLLSGSHARLVALGGVAGTAKERVAYGLAAALRPVPGARVLRSATARRRLVGVLPQARLSAAAYDSETSDRAYAALTAEASQTVQAGFTAIVDAAFVDRRRRQAIAAAATDAALPFVGLWLEVDQEGNGVGGGWHAVGRDAGLAAARIAADEGVMSGLSRRSAPTASPLSRNR